MVKIGGVQSGDFFFGLVAPLTTCYVKSFFSDFRRLYIGGGVWGGVSGGSGGGFPLPSNWIGNEKKSRTWSHIWFLQGLEKAGGGEI